MLAVYRLFETDRFSRLFIIFRTRCSWLVTVSKISKIVKKAKKIIIKNITNVDFSRSMKVALYCSVTFTTRLVIQV